MKRIVLGLGTAFGSVASVLCITAARHEDTIRPNVKVGPVMVGGMTPDEASRTLRVWWESEKLNKLDVSLPKGKGKLPSMKPSEFGVTLDDIASVKDLPIQTFVGDAQAVVTRADFPEETHPLVFKSTGDVLLALENRVRTALGPNRPARVAWANGAIIRKHEVAGFTLDEEKLPEVVSEAIQGDHKVELPLTEAPKHVPDEDLDSIKDVVAEFSTRFSAGNRPRSSNIRLAASKIDGTILMPGDKFSFNGIVGRRTLKAGFKLAGVYKNGRHDTGIGGGICQVSTTLYNSALFANLPVLQRSNHSLPVPYVPIGRDATVDYGNLDLVFQNTYKTPIALTAHYMPGRLTFRILGKKVEGLSVKVTQVGQRAWGSGTQRIFDSSIPSGRTRVVKPGSTGHSVTTYRCVYENGKLVRRERLGFSKYGGEPTVIAVGTGAAPAPKIKTPVVSDPGVGTPPINDPVPDSEPPVPPSDGGQDQAAQGC